MTYCANEFNATRNIFASYTEYTKPLSYDEWMSTDDDRKAAVLYCQFFDQITLAWYKFVSSYSVEQDGVDEILKYLTKNVEIIKNDAKRFTPAYIYTVCYNCLHCLCLKDNKKKRIYDNECVASNIPGYEDDADVFDEFASEDSFESTERDVQRQRLWDLIASKGRETEIVVAELIGDEIDMESFVKTGKARKYSKRAHDKISDKRRQEIIDDLRNDLRKLADLDMLGLLM